MYRRDFLKVTAGAGVLAMAGAAKESSMAEAAAPAEGPAWHDVREWGIEGKGWQETESYFDRLPAKAKSVVRPPVWDLSHDSAGMCVFFETDAITISARWALRSGSLAMNHMAATGVSGLDLYARDERGRWRWAGIGRPERQQTEAKLAEGLVPGRREYCVYLPLYNGVTSVEIGVPAGATFVPMPPRKEKPILFYGTSIVQGGCASRPGMVHTSILSRRLGRPALNFGFSGNGMMEPEMADLFAELDPCLYVLDCLPNMSTPQVAERTEPFVHRLRQAHPDTPIILVEDRTFTNAAFHTGMLQGHADKRAAYRKAYDRLVAAGDRRLGYVPGERLLGDDGEAAVDGSHPTDLGFVRMADALEPVLKRWLDGSAGKRPQWIFDH